MKRPDELLSWGTLRRVPQTPRSLRANESRSARSPLPLTSGPVTIEVDR